MSKNQKTPETPEPTHETQRGIQTPDGKIRWYSDDPYTLADFNQIGTETGQATLQDGFKIQLNQAGVEPSQKLRLRFWERTRVTSYQETVPVTVEGM